MNDFVAQGQRFHNQFTIDYEPEMTTFGLVTQTTCMSQI